VEESKEEQGDDEDGYTESIIEIPSSDRRDAGLFTCLATNLFGKDSKNIQLLVQGAYTDTDTHQQHVRILLSLVRRTDSRERT
jgi:hypothetical protein